MTTSSIAQRQKAAVATLDFNADCWTFGASPDIPIEGHDARSRYVEEFWLPVLGPTCIVILRHLVGLASWQPRSKHCYAGQRLAYRLKIQPPPVPSAAIKLTVAARITAPKR